MVLISTYTFKKKLLLLSSVLSVKTKEGYILQQQSKKQKQPTANLCGQCSRTAEYGRIPHICIDTILSYLSKSETEKLKSQIEYIYGPIAAIDNNSFEF